MSKVFRAVVKIPGTNAYASCDPDAPLTDETSARTIARHYLANVIPHAVVKIENVPMGTYETVRLG